MSRHAIIVAVLTIILTAIGELLIYTTNIFPSAMAEEAEVVDEAFEFLMIVSVPVFSFVVAALLYSVVQFRSRGRPVSDGPPVHGHGPWTTSWLVWSTALTILVIIYPGIIGLNELRASAREPVDLVVEAEASRWFWEITYPDSGVTTMDELVLPVGAHIRFDVTATDVLHAFWIPAFRMKVDAVPGLVTTINSTPTETGDYETEPQLRLQCAELCGLLHNGMSIPVRVVEQAEFDAWLVSQAAAQ